MCTTIKSIFCKKITVYLQIPGDCVLINLCKLSLLCDLGAGFAHTCILHICTLRISINGAENEIISKHKFFFFKSTFHFLNNRCIRTFKGTVSDISSVSSCKDDRFTTVPLIAISDQVYN